jgi:hypothetical protein
VNVQNVELLTPGEHLALNKVLIPTGFILDGELVTPGKYFFFYVELHFLPPSLWQFFDDDYQPRDVVVADENLLVYIIFKTRFISVEDVIGIRVKFPSGAIPYANGEISRTPTTQMRPIQKRFHICIAVYVGENVKHTIKLIHDQSGRYQYE